MTNDTPQIDLERLARVVSNYTICADNLPAGEYVLYQAARAYLAQQTDSVSKNSEAKKQPDLSLKDEQQPADYPDAKRALEDLNKLAMACEPSNETMNLIRSIRAALQSQPQPLAVPEGWKLVPIEPTEAMITAGYCDTNGETEPFDHYRAMISAAPQPPTSSDGAVLETKAEMDKWIQGYACCLANACDLEDWRPSQISGGMTLKEMIDAGADPYDIDRLKEHMPPTSSDGDDNA